MDVGRREMKLGLLVAAAAALVAPATSSASPSARFGVQDDAILGAGPSGDSTLDTLDVLGVRLVRFTVDWRRVAPRRPEHPLDPSDPAYDWTSTDRVLDGLHRRGISVLVTLWKTPAWANGGLGANAMPVNR